MEDKNKEKINVVELFGSNVFNDKIMQERLPKKVYKELHKTIDEGKELDPITAEVVAGAMKDWAVEKGATHYTDRKSTRLNSSHANESRMPSSA